uniref:RNase H type-1 domain-containing protein n=1 Tax=Arion vulgaris TaxID=1028688 RepID=A0A0B6XYS8_9EUPU
MTCHIDKTSRMIHLNFNFLQGHAEVQGTEQADHLADTAVVQEGQSIVQLSTIP